MKNVDAAAILHLLIISSWIASLLYVSVLIRKSTGNNIELGRKIVHIGTAVSIPMAWNFGLSKFLIVSCGILITALTLLNHRWQLLNSIEDIDRRSYGTSAYGFSITFLVALLWPERSDAVTAGILVMGLGDGLAGLIGRSLRSAQWSVLGQTKSVAGTLTMALVSALVLFSLSAISPTPVPWGAVIGLSLLATGLEQLSPLGIDNLTVPLAVGLLWANLT